MNKHGKLPTKHSSITASLYYHSVDIYHHQCMQFYHRNQRMWDSILHVSWRPMYPNTVHRQSNPSWKQQQFWGGTGRRKSLWPPISPPFWEMGHWNFFSQYGRMGNWMCSMAKTGWCLPSLKLPSPNANQFARMWCWHSVFPIITWTEAAGNRANHYHGMQNSEAANFVTVHNLAKLLQSSDNFRPPKFELTKL